MSWLPMREQSEALQLRPTDHVNYMPCTSLHGLYTYKIYLLEALSQLMICPLLQPQGVRD